jgi:hypothetical protein
VTKLVCRLLDADERMLGWCWHIAAMRGDGCLRSTLPVVLDVDVDGEPAVLSVHWADMNVETRVPMPKLTVKKGDTLTIFPAHAAMLRAGEPPTVRLPPVSTKSQVMVDVPVGKLGASSEI